MLKNSRSFPRISFVFTEAGEISTIFKENVIATADDSLDDRKICHALEEPEKRRRLVRYVVNLVKSMACPPKIPCLKPPIPRTLMQ